jgi:hypothetical protein
MDDTTCTTKLNPWLILNKDILRNIFRYCEEGITMLMSFVSKALRQQMALYFMPNLESLHIRECGIKYGNPNIIRLGLGRGATVATIIDEYINAWSIGLTVRSNFVHICNIASRHGHFSMVKFACKHDPMAAKAACNAASIHGELEIVDFAYQIWKDHDENCNLKKIVKSAAEHGHVPILKWAYTIDPDSIDMNKCSWIAIHNGKLEVLEWIIATGYVFEIHIYNNVIIYNRIAVLKWMRTEDPNWNQTLCRNIAKNYCKYDVIKWLDIAEWLDHEGCEFELFH